MYIYIYIYTYTHTYIHTYIYTYVVFASSDGSSKGWQDATVTALTSLEMQPSALSSHLTSSDPSSRIPWGCLYVRGTSTLEDKRVHLLRAALETENLIFETPRWLKQQNGKCEKHNRTSVVSKRQNGKMGTEETENGRNGRDDHAKFTSAACWRLLIDYQQ